MQLNIKDFNRNIKIKIHFKMDYKIICKYIGIELILLGLLALGFNSYVLRSDTLNLIMPFIIGSCLNIIDVVPYNLCRFSDFEIIEKGDKL